MATAMSNNTKISEIRKNDGNHENLQEASNHSFKGCDDNSIVNLFEDGSNSTNLSKMLNSQS